MSLPNLYQHRFGCTLTGGLTHSIRTALHIRTGPTASEIGQSSMNIENGERMDVYTSMRSRVLEDGSCPSCGAIMDREGYSFASKTIVDGIAYYCNNPVCNGIRQSSLIAEGSATKELHLIMVTEEAKATDSRTKELKMI